MKKILLTLLCFCSIMAAQAQVYKTINVTTAGTLSSLLTTEEKSTVTNLTVTGNIDARDIKCLCSEMTILASLDISGVFMNSYNGGGGTSPLTTIYPENEIPLGAFMNNTSLINILLPNNIITIGADAFSGCSGLLHIAIPKSVTKIESRAFLYCSNLKYVRLLNSNPPIHGEVTKAIFNKDQSFNSSYPDFYVPIGSISNYKNSSDTWSVYTRYFESILSITSQSVKGITLSTSIANGFVEFIADTPVSSHGFCWNTTGSPTITDSKVDNGAKTTLGAYSNTISGLTLGTTYYVRAFATDGQRTVYGDEVSFTTASLPSAAGTISGSTTVCQGQSSVTYTVPTIPFATSYAWTLPNGISGTSITNSITVKYERFFTSGTIYVKGINQWGEGASSTLDITANLLPDMAGIITGNKTVCQGENMVSYSVPLINNVSSYTWVLPTGATGTSTTNSIVVNYSNSAISGNITVKGHNDCGDGIVSYAMVTVNKLPIISMTNKTITSGGSVQLNPSISYAGTGTLSYRWSPSSGLNDSTISNPTATLTKPTTYTLTVTSSNGCSASGQMTVGLSKMSAPGIGVVGISNNKNIVVWNKPVSTGIDSYNIYRETNVSNVFAKIGAVAYDSLSVFVDTQSNPDVQSNKYKISILDKNGVESDQSAAHKTMHLSINKGMGSSWNLIWEAYEGFAVSTYNIYRGISASDLTLLGSTSGSSTQYNDVNAPIGNVYYQLEVINPGIVNPSKVSAFISENSALINYAASRSNVASNATTALIDNNMEDFEVYPNPSKGEVTISMEKFEDANYSITVSNTLGQKVYNSKLMSDKTKLDFAQFGKQGIYFVQVIDSKGLIVGRRKVVVE